MDSRLARCLLPALLLLPACKPEDPGTSTTETASDSAQSSDASLSGASLSTTSPATSDDTSSSSASSSSSSGDPSAGTTQGVGECVEIECEGSVLACGDCMDNDGDGLVDLADPECVSPCDDLEDSFATGLPGDNMDACNQDCFFDGNSGSGDDKCSWDLACDPASPGGDKCPYDPDAKCPEMQDEECLMNCAVPSGCDCFGCCTVQVGEESVDIFIGGENCSIATIDQCTMCTKSVDCDDECEPEKCELCFGQDPEDLPPECDGGGECPEGVQACAIDEMGGSDCPMSYYCFLGCCELAPG